MIMGVTVWAGALRLALWKRLAVRGRRILQFAIIGVMPFSLAAAALPAQAATVTQNPPGVHLLVATRTALQLQWSPSPGATSYTYRLYQMDGVLVWSGWESGSDDSVICPGLHPGWRYRAEVWANPGRPGSEPYATLYMTLPGPNPPRELAYQWAQTQAGTPYRYGSQGDGAYDCSGLVRAAYLHAGIWLPRTTGEMLQYWRLEPVAAPQQGDLVFFGTGHVELYAARDQSFGAEDNPTGTGWNRWWPGDWWPTAFYRIVGAG
jgi:NlpC/P60 family